MSAASQAAGAPGGGGGGGDIAEYEIRNDEGFVFKVRRGLYPDAAPSTTQPAAGPDPKAAGLRRRRRALLRLRDKRLRDLSRLQALAAELDAPLPAPHPPASPPASSSAPDASSEGPDATAASSSTSILDDLLVQVDLQTELMKKARQWCDEANAVCDAREAAIFDSIAPLPLWGSNPSELMQGLCSSGDLDEQNGHLESSGVFSAAAEKITFPPILTEGRKKASSTSTAPGAPRSARKKPPKSPCASTAPSTPGSVRKKLKSTPARPPFIVGSPGALTRRRAAANNESPVGSEKAALSDWTA